LILGEAAEADAGSCSAVGPTQAKTGLERGTIHVSGLATADPSTRLSLRSSALRMTSKPSSSDCGANIR